MSQIIKQTSRWVVMIMALATTAAWGQAGIEQLAEISGAEPATRATTPTDNSQLSALLKDLEPQGTYLYNSFLGRDKVLTLDGNNRLMMADVDREHDNTRQQWRLQQQSNGMYRIWNMALGEGMNIDSDTAKPHMAKMGNYSGQFWTLDPSSNGWYRLYNSYQGPTKVLDTYNSPGNYLFFEARTRNTTGTFWQMRLVPAPEDVIQFVPLSPRR